MKPNRYHTSFSRFGRQLNNLFTNHFQPSASSATQITIRELFSTADAAESQANASPQPPPTPTHPIVLIPARSTPYILSPPRAYHSHIYWHVLSPPPSPIAKKKSKVQTPAKRHSPEVIVKRTRRHGFFGGTKIKKSARTVTCFFDDETEDEIRDRGESVGREGSEECEDYVRRSFFDNEAEDEDEDEDGGSGGDNGSDEDKSGEGSSEPSVTGS